MAGKGSGKEPVKVVRDARTGQFVPPREAGRRPATTVTETVRRTGKKLRRAIRTGIITRQMKDLIIVTPLKTEKIQGNRPGAN